MGVPVPTVSSLAEDNHSTVYERIRNANALGIILPETLETFSLPCKTPQYGFGVVIQLTRPGKLELSSEPESHLDPRSVR